MKIKRFTPKNCFFLVASISLLVYLANIIWSEGRFLDRIIYAAGTDTYSDFYMHIYRFYGYENVYAVSSGSCFPPLSYIFYGILSRILKHTGITSWKMVANGYAILVPTMLLVIWAVLFSSFVKKLYRNGNEGESIGLSILLICSVPFFATAIEKSNSVLYALLLLMMALYFKDCDSKTLREIALICIATAAGLKIYPAIIGVIYIKEKRYKEVVRLIIYGILFFFTPFIFFDGFEGMRLFLQNISEVNGRQLSSIETIVGLVTKVWTSLGGGVTSGYHVGKILSYIYFLYVLVCFFIEKYSWKSMTLIVSLMIVFTVSSYRYTLIYFSIPLIMFLVEMKTKNGYSWSDYLYALLFALIFWMYPIRGWLIPESDSMTIWYYPAYLLLFALCCEFAQKLFIHMKKGIKAVEKKA